MYPQKLKKLIERLAKFPSLGPKSAERVGLYLLNRSSEEVAELSRLLLEVKSKIHFCENCHALTEDSRCTICNDPKRNQATVCVVEEPPQIEHLEGGGFRGVYYVLQGSINPLEGKDETSLKVGRLVKKVSSGQVKEIILATNEEFTTLYLMKLLKEFPVRITRLARGIPVGSKLEYMDELTLKEALKTRREV